MSNERRRVNIGEWPRAEIFRFFSSVANPFYLAAFDIDVTALFDRTGEKKLSFYRAMIYICAKAVNSIPAFLYTAEGEDVFMLDERIPSFTYMEKGEELFRIITVPVRGSMDDFCREAGEKCASQKQFIDQSSEGDDLIYISCLPWLDLTALSNELDVGAPGFRDDSIPRIAWGRIKEREGKKYLNLSVEVNHRFIDGVHIGQLAAKIEELIAACR